MLSSMSSREITEWMAWYSIEPFGEVRSDMRAAMIAGYVAAGAGAKNIKLEDFMLNFEPPKVMSPEEMKDVLRRL